MRQIDIDAVRGPVFALADRLGVGAHGWHAHRAHQLLYVSTGLLQVEVEGHGRTPLPPRRAALVTGGARHRVTVRAAASLRTVYFGVDFAPPPEPSLAVFPVTPVLREMVLHAQRWAPEHTPSELSRSFFETLWRLAREASEGAWTLRRPDPRHPVAAAAVAHLCRDLRASLRETAAAAHSSPRTLQRVLDRELGASFLALRGQLRIVEAVERLVDPHLSLSTLAHELGYATPSAFSSAFRAAVGEPPSRYARRLRGG